METRLKLVLFVRYFGLFMLPQGVLIAFIIIIHHHSSSFIIIYHVDYFCTAFNMVLGVCQYLPNITLISTVLLFSDLPRTGQDPCLGWYNVHKMGSTYPICMNRVSPDILWCQESYTFIDVQCIVRTKWLFLVIFGYCVKNDGQGTTTLCRICREVLTFFYSALTFLYASYQEDLRKVSFVKIESFLAELWRCNGCVRWGTQWSFWHWSIEMGEDLKNNACSIQRI
jgi:hypothetical protein